MAKANIETEDECLIYYNSIFDFHFDIKKPSVSWRVLKIINKKNYSGLASSVAGSSDVPPSIFFFNSANTPKSPSVDFSTLA